MADYNSIHTGAEIDTAVSAVAPLDTAAIKKTGDFVMAGELDAKSLKVDGISITPYGNRNIIIDGEVGRINQSEFNGNWSSVADGDYGFDIWMRETSTTIKQIVEEGGFTPGAVYTLSGVGVTEQQITAPASGNWTIGNIPNTATLVQVERGEIATEFERVPISDQLARVHRYYNRLVSNNIFMHPVTSADTKERYYQIFHPVVMVKDPNVTMSLNTGSPSLGITKAMTRVSGSASANAASLQIIGDVEFDARLT